MKSTAQHGDTPAGIGISNDAGHPTAGRANLPDYDAIGRQHAVDNFELLRRLGISAEDAESASMALAAAQTGKLVREGATAADLALWLAGYVDAGKNLAIREMTPAGTA